MKVPKLSKHDRYVLELSQKINDDYDSISLNVPFKECKKSVGEVDILATKGDRTDLFEVKCSYRPMKAKKQLSRMQKYLKLKNSKTFFYCGNSGLLMTI